LRTQDAGATIAGHDRHGATMTRKKQTFDFEAALTELESLIERMETGELGLEESLKAFERGVALTRECQGALKQAELRVQALTESAAGPVLAPLDEDEIEPDDDA
jgi:exodeoxyribonuclease VII small subunit